MGRMTIELTCRRIHGGAVLSIEGEMEGDPHALTRLFEGGVFDLSDIDPRIQWRASITENTLGATRCALRGIGPATIEGRALEAGDRVRIATDGPIAWSR
jgi:hypothetical protein